MIVTKEIILNFKVSDNLKQKALNFIEELENKIDIKIPLNVSCSYNEQDRYANSDEYISFEWFISISCEGLKSLQVTRYVDLSITVYDNEVRYLISEDNTDEDGIFTSPGLKLTELWRFIG